MVPCYIYLSGGIIFVRLYFCLVLLSYFCQLMICPNLLLGQIEVWQYHRGDEIVTQRPYVLSILYLHQICTTSFLGMLTEIGDRYMRCQMEIEGI